MSIRVDAAVAAVLAMAALLLAAPGAAGTPLAPANLLVEGGEENWHPDRRFDLSWTNSVAAGGPPVVAVHYRLRDPAGAALGAAHRIGWPARSIHQLEVPRRPGAYTVEIRLEDASGEVGPVTSASLRFDDTRPGGIEPLARKDWVGRTSFPLSIRLGRPAGAAPISGIRGYAISVARLPDSRPCARADRCTEAETDLRGGATDDSYLVADLPEGTNYVTAVAVSGSGMTSTIPGRAVLRVDETSPAVNLSGAVSGWTNRPVLLTATASDDRSGMAPDGGSHPPFTAIAVDGGTPAIAPGPSVTASVIGEGVHRVAYYARDLAGNVDDGAGSNGLPNPAPATTLVRIDRSPPRVSLVLARDPRDVELIRARIDDSISGPNPARGWIGVRGAGTGDRFERLPAAPPVGRELRARWDSDAYPAGEYEFRAVGYDAAGNATATNRAADGRPMVLPAPLKAPTTIHAGFGPHERDGGTVAPGRRPLLSGRVTAGAGMAPSGTPVRIVERFAGGTEPGSRISIATTDRRGTFAIRLPRGPSREVTAIFDGSATLARTSTAAMRLGVRARVRLRVSSALARVGGRALIFRGQIVAAPGTIPSGGRAVQLQFRLPGLPWSEFRTIQTDRRGRFRYPYRFSDDDSRGARFQFRAYAPAQDGWPYEPGSSRPIVVRGR